MSEWEWISNISYGEADYRELLLINGEGVATLDKLSEFDSYAMMERPDMSWVEKCLNLPFEEAKKWVESMMRLWGRI